MYSTVMPGSVGSGVVVGAGTLGNVGADETQHFNGKRSHPYWHAIFIEVHHGAHDLADQTVNEFLFAEMPEERRRPQV